MNMLRFGRVILGFYALICLSLGHFKGLDQAQAQTLQLPPPPVTAITPNPGGTTPTTTVPTTLPLPSTTSSTDPTKPTIVKYYEVKSICLQPEVIEKPLSTTTKEKRLALLRDKLKKSESEKNSELTSTVKALLIKEHLKQGNTRQAEDLFKTESAALSEVDAVLLSADIDVEKGLLRQAKNNLNLFLEKHSKNIAALEKIAEVYISLKSYSEARMAYEDLAKINSKKDYTEKLCETSSFDADHLNVEIYCNRLIKKYPQNNLGHIYLGISFRDQEKYKEATQNFQTSLKIKPSEFASTCLAEIYFLNSDYNKAISQFEESIKLQPESQRAHLGLANTYVKRNLFSEALQYYKKSCLLGLKPLTEMFSAANTLKTQKSNLSDSYFDEIQKCKEIPGN